MATQQPNDEVSVGGSSSDGIPIALRNRSASLQRALNLLDFIASSAVGPAGISIAELAVGTGLNKSTSLRLLVPLAQARLVEQDPKTKSWRLGPHTAYLGQIYLERLDLRTVAHLSSGATCRSCRRDRPLGCP